MLPNWLYGKSLRKLQEILNSGGQTAEDVSYSNTESGLEATNAQAAIDELTDDVASINEPFFKDGIRWNYGMFLEWASPSFNSQTTQLGSMTILDIFNAMPVESSGVSYAQGSSIKIGTYNGNRPLFNDIVRWFNLSSIGAGVLEIIKFETSRALVRYTKSDSAEIYEGWIISNAMGNRYKYEGAAIS